LAADAEASVHVVAASVAATGSTAAWFAVTEVAGSAPAADRVAAAMQYKPAAWSAFSEGWDTAATAAACAAVALSAVASLVDAEAAGSRVYDDAVAAPSSSAKYEAAVVAAEVTQLKAATAWAASSEWSPVDADISTHAVAAYAAPALTSVAWLAVTLSAAADVTMAVVVPNGCSFSAEIDRLSHLVDVGWWALLLLLPLLIPPPPPLLLKGDAPPINTRETREEGGCRGGSTC
jgi:hypothetical protein